MPSTTYVTQSFQSSVEMTKFLNTGSSVSAGTPVLQAKIVTAGFDPGSGRFFVILAPGY